MSLHILTEIYLDLVDGENWVIWIELGRMLSNREIVQNVRDTEIESWRRQNIYFTSLADKFPDILEMF